MNFKNYNNLRNSRTKVEGKLSDQEREMELISRSRHFQGTFKEFLELIELKIKSQN